MNRQFKSWLYITCTVAVIATVFSSFNASAAIKEMPNEENIYLNIYFVEAKANDTLTIKIDDMFHIITSTPRKIYFSTRDRDGYFRFIIPVKGDHGYFTLSKARLTKAGIVSNLVEMIKPLLWEKSDSINLKISYKDNPLGRNGICEFKGIGSEKYTASYKIMHLPISSNAIITHMDSLYRKWDGNILKREMFDSQMYHTLKRLDVLDTYRDKISVFCYNVFKADILYAGTSVLGMTQNWAANGGMGSLKHFEQDEFIKKFNTSFDYPRNFAIDPIAMAYSIHYLIHLNRKFQTASLLNTGKYSLEWIYKELKNYQVSSQVRDIMVMMFLTRITFNSENPVAVYNDALSLIKNPEYLEVLRTLFKSVPGARFAEFTLEDSYGKNRSLSEFLGKVVLLDIWYTGCGGCIGFYTGALSKVERLLSTNPNVKFLSISIDRNKEIWRKSIAGGQYTSLESVNLYTGGLMNKHPLIINNNILSYPSVILLDKEGKIRFFNSENLRNEKSLLKAINDLL